MTTFLRIFFLLITASASAANLLPNSSFDTGYNHGWNCYSTGPNQAWGNMESGAGLITNYAHSGRIALRIPTGARVNSTMIRLTNGTYNLSGYGIGSGNLPFGVFNATDLGGGNPPNTATLNSSTWTRFTATFTASSNAEYWVRFGFVNADTIIDDIQLEPGSSATTYTVQSAVECGPTIPGTNNMQFSGDTPTANLNLWNTGGAGNVQASVEVYDAWNSNLMSVVISPLIAGGTNTVVPVVLPSKFGWFRLLTRLPTVSGSEDEMTYVHYPYPSNILTRAKSWLGSHPHISEHYAARERYAYRDSARGLSPNFLSRWQLVQPSTNTDFVWFDVGYTNWNNAGLDMVLCLTPGDTTWNEWATNANGSASMSAWSNYCYLIVRRMTVTLGLTNTYFEVGPNESDHTGPIGDTTKYPGINVSDSESGLDYTGTNLPINSRVATNYATLLGHAVAGITNAYSHAKIIAFSGAYQDGAWAYKVWTNTSAATRAAISVWSTHQYPDDNSDDPNIGHFQESKATRPQPWISYKTNNVEIWNTESGTYGQGSILGRNGLWPIAFFTHYTTTYEANRSQWNLRQLVSIAREVTQGLRCIGFGMDRFFQYDERWFNDSYFNTIVPYGADYLQVDLPYSVGLSCAAYLVAKGFGPITNALNGAGFPYLEMYAFTNWDGLPVVAAWSADRVNKTLTLTNSNFELLDVFGNQLSTGSLSAATCRIPRYFRSGTLTLAQLSNTLAYAAVANAFDVLPPQISIDIAPSGLWNGDTNEILIKWSAIDDKDTAFPSEMAATNVTTKWKIDGGPYSVYSASNFMLYPNLPAGNHTIYVTATDSSGNTSEKAYQFVPSGGSLNVSGTWTVTGNLTIGSP